MKSCSRGKRRLAGLLKVLKRLRLAYARALAKDIKVRGDLPGRILDIKAKIARVSLELGHRQDAA